MRKTFSLLTLAVAVGVLASGCANVERKLGRGLSNSFEIVRGGEFRRTMEQTALFDSPDEAYSTGFVRGIGRTLSRTGIGIYEVVTAPIPPYDPLFTNTYAPNPVYPDNYTPGLVEDSLFATDTYIGYSGGDVIPFVPGSRFRVFDTH
ncbi:MAG TPA: exosortase system-associated protein, TIGR04073 family [Candidatus Paceibacterota bacterium]|nr:exosortase system-associated protein, TIGR04073 family [Candidatus Paceibacterota bacterium]